MKNKGNSVLKREDAFYYENLLALGLREEYDKWLEFYLSAEDPLSDIVLELSLCGSDVNGTIAVLCRYRTDGPVDENAVCDRLREFFKQAYHSKKMDKREIVYAMYTVASHADPFDIGMQIWGSMYHFEYYYSLAEEGTISWDGFDRAFLSYLDDGVPLDSVAIWDRSKKSTLFERIKRFFK